MKRRKFQSAQRRTGSVLVMTTIMMVALIGILALSLDLGYLQLAKTELQQCADAAALAAANELFDNDALTGQSGLTAEITNARNTAVRYAALNKVCSSAPVVGTNTANSPSGDVVIGFMSNPSDPSNTMTYTNPNQYNAVQVTVRRSAGSNGEVSFFFGRIFGGTGLAMEAKGTAALLNNVGGFHLPHGGSGGNLMMLPFALDKTTWDNMLAGGGTDTWTWDASTSTIHSGSDGVREVNLYPQGLDAPGNRGTVDIGGSNNSTADIARQIVHGVNADDMSHFPNSELKFDAAGNLYLNGDTGISAGVKDELAEIKGQARLIPIFSTVSGNGNNAVYTVVAFSAVRIMDVNLTGSQSSKRVIIQPCQMAVNGAMPSTNGTQSSYFVYSPVWLVR